MCNLLSDKDLTDMIKFVTVNTLGEELYTIVTFNISTNVSYKDLTDESRRSRTTFYYSHVMIDLASGQNSLTFDES